MAINVCAEEKEVIILPKEKRYEMLPPVDSEDDGKIVQVVDGEWNVTDAPCCLPEVTTADNGKVLKVVNGAWQVAESGSSLNILQKEITVYDMSVDANSYVTKVQDVNVAYHIAVQKILSIEAYAGYVGAMISITSIKQQNGTLTGVALTLYNPTSERLDGTPRLVIRYIE